MAGKKNGIVGRVARKSKKSESQGGGNGWGISSLHKQVEEVYKSELGVESWLSEKDGVLAGLKGIAQSIDQVRYRPLAVLGVGGSGIVLRLSDRQFPNKDSALKFPRPVHGKIKLVADLLGKEIKYLAQLRHPGIVRILYYAICEEVDNYNLLPFYIMEAINGVPSGKFIQRITEPQQLIGLIRHAAEVLCYLHSIPEGGFAHLDLKPDNFVVDDQGKPIMIDLGTCKRLGAKESDYTTIACTLSYAHPELVRQLAKDPSDDNRAKGDISRSEIDPRWDLWSFGLMILSWLGFDPNTGDVETQRILNMLSAYDRKYMLLLAARLLGDNIPMWLPKRIGLSDDFINSLPVNSAADLRGLILRLQGSHGPLDRIPEFELRQSSTMQAAPGVHIAVTARVAAVLQHRLFRRLNTISQLGLVSQVYPGAKHTRREHSLGTYANAIRMIKSLYGDPISPLFRQIILDSDCRDVLLASLLHDLGHFPLAHDLEEIDSKMFSHRDLTHSMLKGAWDKRRKGSKKIVFDSLEPIFKLWETGAERILSILRADPANVSASPKQRLLRSLISGPIDADKLDYLFRDARHLDLPYPNGVDVDRLFQCLTTVVINRIEGGAKDVPAVGVHSKGKVAAEFLSVARYAMFSQAYWHHAVRAQKAMLLRAVEALFSKASTDLGARGFQSDFLALVCALPESLYRYARGSQMQIPEKVDQRTAIGGGRGTDLAATDAAVLSWFHQKLIAKRQPEASLIEGILTRTLFKRLWVVSHEMERQRWRKIVGLYGPLGRDGRHRVANEFEKAIASKIRKNGVPDVTTLPGATAVERIGRLTSGQEPWLLIDIPGGRPGSDVGLHYVLESQRRTLRKDDRSVGDLQRSTVWGEYAKNLLSAAGKVRVFCHPDLADSVEAAVPWNNGIEELIAVLERMST